MSVSVAPQFGGWLVAPSMVAWRFPRRARRALLRKRVRTASISASVVSRARRHDRDRKAGGACRVGGRELLRAGATRAARGRLPASGSAESAARSRGAVGADRPGLARGADHAAPVRAVRGVAVAELELRRARRHPDGGLELDRHSSRLLRG